MIKASVSGLESVKKAIADELKKYTEAPTVLVGIHEDAPQPEEGSINMATLGAIQHFGNDVIPARPWLDVGVATGNKEYIKIMQSATEAGEDINQALSMVGVLAVGNVQEYMTTLSTPANSEKTIKRKKSSNPLINTGIMRSSVTYTIDNVKPEEGI